MDTADLEKPIDPKNTQRIRQGTHASVNTRAGISERNRIDGFKSKFIAAISHDPRAPLTAVIGGLRMLKDDPLVTIPRSG